MKHIFLSIFFLLFFLTMIIFPSQALVGATNGLLLWFQIVIPTLLPAIIISNVLIFSNSIPYITKYFGVLIQKLFHVSSAGSFAALTGFLCGYPVGAKVTADLVKSKQISVSEGNYLLSFCNNTSPSFISSFIVLQQFHDPALLLPTMLILYGSNYMCSLVFRKYYKNSFISFENTFLPICFHFPIIDSAIMNSFETITKVGGYIILFSILFQWIPFPFFEITNGIQYLTSQINTFPLTYVSILGLTSFGGICSIIQTCSVIQGSNLSLISYIIEKLITALVTSLLAFLYVTIILR